jgi:hypothetical protein
LHPVPSSFPWENSWAFPALLPLESFDLGSEDEGGGGGLEVEGGQEEGEELGGVEGVDGLEGYEEGVDEYKEDEELVEEYEEDERANDEETTGDRSETGEMRERESEGETRGRERETRETREAVTPIKHKNGVVNCCLYLSFDYFVLFMCFVNLVYRACT